MIVRSSGLETTVQNRRASDKPKLVLLKIYPDEVQVEPGDVAESVESRVEREIAKVRKDMETALANYKESLHKKPDEAV